jgi:hypothetical protein
LRHHPLSRCLRAAALVVVFHATYASAETRNPWAIDWAAPAGSAAGAPVALPAVHFGDIAPGSPAEEAFTPAGINLDVVTLDAQSAQGQEQVNARPRSFQYSHGYEVRRKIHVYSSYATLPLFAAEIYLGEQLYRGGFTDGQRTAHQFVAGTIGVLFGVNTVTGVWNLKEGWGDPAHHTLRVTHGIMMLAADAGFVATGMMAPNRYGEGGSPGGHRAMAYASIGVATASYLIMLFGR